MNKIEKEKYFNLFYSNPLLAYCQNWGHIQAEKFIQPNGITLDLGCGAFDHVPFNKNHGIYIEVDIDFEVLTIGKNKYPNMVAVCADAQCLPFKENCFDNILSIYNLEHIPDLQSCCLEISRILKQSGNLAVCLPTEGFAFRMGRRYVSARFAVKELGIKNVQEYEKIVAENHINTLEKIREVFRNYFLELKTKWFPFCFFPWKSVNINFAAKLTKKRFEK